MASPGRNDPCPCGSGRKFKQCCLGKADAESAARLNLFRAEGRIVRDVLAWAPTRFSGAFIRAALDDFYLGEPPDPEERDEAEFDQMFVPWFVFGYVADPNAPNREPDWPSVPLAECWADAEMPDLSALEREFLAAACDSPLSVFVIEAVDSGRGLDVRDVLTGRAFRVLELEASHQLRKADLLFTRVVTAGGASIMTGGSPLAVPPDRHTDVLAWRDGLFRKGMPTRVDLVDRDIEIRGFYFGLVDALRNPAPPIVAAMEADLRRQYAIEWLDTSVPALGEETPRAAVRTPGGRERVEALLAGFERHAADEGWQDEEVFRVMRRELGLE